MGHSKAIIVNALSRGGSNILWNILQSHPAVCSPIRETGALITENIIPFSWFPPATGKRLATYPIVPLLGKPYLRHVFHKWKLKNVESASNNTKYQGVPYTREEVENSIICFKGVDSDLDLNDLLESLYDEVSYVGLVRNGYAICNGWMRRGISATTAGKLYRSRIHQMLEKRDSAHTFALIKFEEMIRDPFGTAQHLFEVLELQDTELPKLRLKSKRVLSQAGEHQTMFGQEGEKQWLGPSEISQVLDADIDARQIAQLDARSREAFESRASDILAELGYLD